MPKVTVREDGSSYIRAKIHPGSIEIRVWELKPEGVRWLSRRGVRIDQEMGRSLFRQLLQLGYAYIANTSGKRTVKSSKRKIKGVSVEVDHGPQGPRRVITVPVNMAPARTNHVGRPSRTAKRNLFEAVSTGPAPSAEESERATPEHWKNRTVKKDWFK